MTMTDYAGLPERILSHMIDSVFLIFSVMLSSALVALLSWVVRPLAIPFTGHYYAFGFGLLVLLVSMLIVPFIYFTYFIGKFGQTLGKSVDKIKAQPSHSIFMSNGNDCREWVRDYTWFDKGRTYIGLDPKDANKSQEQNCLSGWW